MKRALFFTLSILAVSRLSLADSAATLKNTGGPLIEAQGPHGGFLGRALSPGWSLALVQGTPQITPFSKNQALVVWYGKEGSAVSILEASGGQLREIWTDFFDAGWTIQAARDFNKDGRPDFLLTRAAGDGDHRSFDCAVAVWDPEKGIDLVTDPVTLVPQCRGAFFTTGDVTGDGAADVVFHSFDYGGSFETRLFMLKGRGDGTLDPEPKKVQILASPHSASNPVLEDLDADGDLDVFLFPDDDVADEGQCYVAFNRGDGQMENLKPSVDLSPASEEFSADEFVAMGSLADTDNDGRLDLVAGCYLIPQNAWEIRLHRGIGNGQFEEQGKVVASGVNGKTPPPPALAWIAWPGGNASAPVVEPPEVKEMEAWWTALGSAKPREAARAMGSFLRAAPAVVDFLAEKVPAGGELDEKRIRRLIVELDDDDYQVREKATAELEGLADLANAILIKALEEATSAEVKVRLRTILDNPAAGLPSELKAEDRIWIRLVALLEAMQTSEALDVLGKLEQPNLPRAIRQAAAEAAKRLGR